MQILEELLQRKYRILRKKTYICLCYTEQHLKIISRYLFLYKAKIDVVEDQNNENTIIEKEDDLCSIMLYVTYK